MRRPPQFAKLAFYSGLLIGSVALVPLLATAQVQAPAPAASARRIGTIKALTGDGFSMQTDDGQQLVIVLQEGARLLALPPGSKDLKSAQPTMLKDITQGDRALVTGKTGDDTRTFGASLVVVMKAGDIAQQHEAEQSDWQHRGSGGIVSAVDPAGTITLKSGAKTVSVIASANTKFRRYAPDSVRFEDARPGTLGQVQVGDQLRVLGSKSTDGATIQAEQVVSGSFRNISGLIGNLDKSSGSLSLKDLATKKSFTVLITSNTSVRTLPAQLATHFAARAKAGASTSEGDGGAGERRSAGMELSEAVNRLPGESIGDLKTGDAVMIVASSTESAGERLTAVTVLAGVEPILSAAPSGPQMTLSPWSVGGSDASSQ